MFNTEEDLLVCLGIQEPDVTATISPEDITPGHNYQHEEPVAKPANKPTAPVHETAQVKPLKPILHVPVHKQ